MVLDSGHPLRLTSAGKAYPYSAWGLLLSGVAEKKGTFICDISVSETTCCNFVKLSSVSTILSCPTCLNLVMGDFPQYKNTTWAAFPRTMFCLVLQHQAGLSAQDPSRGRIYAEDVAPLRRTSLVSPFRDWVSGSLSQAFFFFSFI